MQYVSLQAEVAHRLLRVKALPLLMEEINDEKRCQKAHPIVAINSGPNSSHIY